MEKAAGKNILFYFLIILTALLPLTISGYFYNINDLPKSSVLLLFGGVIIVFTAAVFTIKSLKEKTVTIKYAGIVDYGILLFVFSLGISSFFSLRPEISFFGQYERQFGLITYLYIAGLFFVAGSLTGARQKKMLLLTMETVSVIISVYAVLQIFHADPFDLQPGKVIRPVGSLGNAVFLGGFLVLSLPFSAFNLSGKKKKLLKIIFPAVIFAGIIVTGTRSAYIALVIQALLAYLLFYRKNKEITLKNKKQLITGIILTAVIAVLFMLLYNNSYLAKRIIQVFNFNNPRLILWQDSFRAFLNYPVAGCGPGMFPAALEEVYSNALRYSDASVVHDHAHSNYLQILCTAGLIGLAAYIFFLFSVFKSALKQFRDNKAGTFENKISLAVVVMAAGYVFYGLTNFDDIAVTFYLFMYLAVFRSVITQIRQINISFPQKTIIILLFLFIALGCVLTGYRTVNNLMADRNFLLANVEYGKLNFSKGLELNNKAIILNPECSPYRFTEASRVYDFCFDNSGLKAESKQKLLVQVESEIGRIKENLYFINYCNGLLSLVYYEQGRKDEAEKLKNEVLAKDTMNINYRIKLARYLLKENRLEEAYRSINLALLIKPKEISVNALAAVYFKKINDKDKAITYSRIVLEADPQNEIALNILKEYGVN